MSERVVCRARLAMFLLTTAVTVPVAAIAQDAAPIPEASYSGGLTDIVVTAQRRSQNVQDTPLSITAVGGETLAALGVTNVQDMGRIDPTLQFGQSAGAVQTFIRGIGNPVTTAGNEASVPVYIDDVYYVRASPAFLDLANIDRVEVLKGPQGTLFGRNASGGVIAVHTRDPDHEPRLEAMLGYGNYRTAKAQIYASTPLTDTLAMDFSFSGLDQDKGWGKNLTTGNSFWKNEHVSLRSKMVWTPTDQTKVRLVAYYAKSNNQQGIYNRPFPGTVSGTPDGISAGFPNPPGFPDPSEIVTVPGFYDTVSDVEVFVETEGYGGSLRLDQDMGFADFVSVSAIRHSDETYLADNDNSPYDYLQYRLAIVDEQFSQEIQLNSRPDSPFTWILGGFYLNTLQGFDPTTITGPGANTAGVHHVNIVGTQRIKSYATFGQITYPVAESLNLTGGLRYTKDKVSGEGYTTMTLLPEAGGLTLKTQEDSFKETFNKLTYKAAIDYSFSDAAMVYASYSRGYKSGTHNTLPLDSAALKPEVVDAYEIGVKSEFFDRRVRLNAALFWNDISDAQVQTQRAGLVALVNAGTARTRGVEANLSMLVLDDLTFNMSGTYLDAKFRDFQDCPTYDYSATSPGNLRQLFMDCSGNRMPYASKLRLSGSLNYTRDVQKFGNLALDLNANYASSFYWDADNLDGPSLTVPGLYRSNREKAHFFLDGSLTFTPEFAENTSIRLWMKNITGVKYNMNYYAQASSAAFSSSPGAPRTYGAEFRFRF